MSEYVHTDRTTIHEYVTSPSLDPAVANTPDEHGIYPVNPLGFPEINHCEGDAGCISEGNPEFPQSGNFSSEFSTETIPDAYMEIAVNVDLLSGDCVVVPVESFVADPDTPHQYHVTVKGDLTAAVDILDAIGFGNGGYEDYSITGLMDGNSTIVGEPSYDGTHTIFDVSNPQCTITGRVGPDRLNAVIGMPVASGADSIDHVLLTAQDNRAENGLYRVTGENEPWVRIASVGRTKGTPLSDAEDPYNSVASIDNTPTCGHLRHGYSDREVAEYVERKAGEVISGATHPMSVPGDLSGAGALTRWFVECGNVDIGSSHEGGASVTVEGFGLGGYLGGECTYGSACSRARRATGDGLPVERPVTTFSIGTKRPSGSEPEETLPRDWPFTATSAYSGTDIDNNITLLRKSDDGIPGLPTEVTDTCPACGGSGTYEGESCTRCGGTGTAVTARVEPSRIHVCVNSDFSPYGDDTTRFKKTFIHLPAPIDTRDGEEYEVTVSLPTVNADAAYSSDDMKNLSAYYEYVSSPRVVVMSGYWKFSGTRVSWNESERTSERPYVTGIIDAVGDNAHQFVDSEGNSLPTGITIRFTLDGGRNCPRHTDMTGTLTLNDEGHITISDLVGYPYTARLRDVRMSICGAAYLVSSDDGLPTSVDMPMGLHSRNEGTLERDDAGSGQSGALDEFNKFIEPLSGKADSDRTGICEKDARQVVATVYPTVTSTFPWSVVGRHRMKHLDSIMTDEWDIGEDSVSAMIWDSNKKVIDFTDTVEFFGYGNSCYGFTAGTMPTRYSSNRFAGLDDVSVIGSQLRIRFSPDGYGEASSNPVRQARKAAAMMADDFRKLRMFHGGRLPKITGASRIMTSDEPVHTPLDEYFNEWNPDGIPSESVTGNAVASAAWLSKARHLPEYVITSGQDLGADGNSLIGADPFVDAPVSGRYSAEFAREKYGNSHYGSRDGHETVPCEVKLPGHDAAFSYRSVISAMVESDPDAVNNELYGDANRVAELQKVSIDKWSSAVDYDFTDPYGYLVDSSDFRKWMDIYSATANVFSMDTVPYPDDCQVPQGMGDGQKAMLSGDPMAAYNAESGSSLEFTAVNIPFYDDDSPRSEALAGILRRMVSPYGSRMPVRFWDGTRIAIATDGVKNNSVAELTRLAWPEAECDMSGMTRRDMIDDMFISRSQGSNTVDVNLNHVVLGSTLHMNWSAPTAKVGRNWYSRAPFAGTDDFAGPSGYVRVFMKFKFSVQSGRWYAVDYRQAPMSYLTPLYGARALEETVNGVRIWSESRCAPCGDWKTALMHPYYKYTPMDISPDAMPGMVVNAPSAGDMELENDTDLPTSQVSLPRFARPYLPVEDGGLGLNAPCGANGESAPVADLANMPHANFWSVRKHLRPAVSVLDGSDIPGFRVDGNGARIMSRTGGTMGDAVLWGQFDFPVKGTTEYRIPEA